MQQDGQQGQESTRALLGRTAPGGHASQPGTPRSRPSRVPAVDVGAALQEARAAVVSAQDVLEGVVDEVRERGSGAVEALAGRRPVRRWPWAVGAAVAGAAAGAGVALLVRTVLGEDAPGAQEPEQLQAVIDLDARVTLPPH